MGEKTLNERLNNLKLFPIRGEKLDFDKATDLIRMHEASVGSEIRKVVFLDLSIKENWKLFLAEEDDFKYYLKYDDEVWSKKVSRKRIATSYINSAFAMQNLFTAVLKNAYRFSGVAISEKDGKRFIDSFLHWVIVVDLCEKFPVGGGNIFTPIISIIESGFMPRSGKEKWILGYMSEPIVEKTVKSLFGDITKKIFEKR